MISLLFVFQLRVVVNVSAKKVSMAVEKFASTLTNASVDTILCVMRTRTARTPLVRMNVHAKLATRATGRIAGYLTFVD